MVIIFQFHFFNFRKTNPNLLPLSYNGSPKYDSFKRLEEQKTMLKSFYWLAPKPKNGCLIIGHSWGSFLNDLQNLDEKEGSRKNRDTLIIMKSFKSGQQIIVNLKSNTSQFSLRLPVLYIDPGGGGVLNKVIYGGGSAPKSNPLTLSYTILAEEIPLLYTFY